MPAVVGQHLAEVALLIEQADADHGHVQVAGAFQVIARQNAQAARVDRQRLGKPEFHAEIGDPAEFRLGVLRAEPARALHVLILPLEPALEFPDEDFIGRRFVQDFLMGILQDHVGIVASAPGFRIEPPPDLRHGLAPDQTQIESEFCQAFQRFGQGTSNIQEGHGQAPKGRGAVHDLW